jgi:nucleoid-associated protein YgaU
MPEPSDVASVDAVISQAQQAHLPPPTTHRVRGGESLSTIAKIYYGDEGKWPFLLLVNPALQGKPDLIRVGTVLDIPKESDLPTQLPRHDYPSKLPADYTVHVGDSLAAIALGCYGDETKATILVEANPVLKARVGQQLQVGLTLHIPTANEDAAVARNFPTQFPARYVTQPGDSLTFIAERCYGSKEEWRRIFEANRDILKEPTLLPVEVTILLPKGD